MAVGAAVGAAVGIATAVNGGIQQRNVNQAMINAGISDTRNQQELQKAIAKTTDARAKDKIISDSQANIIASQRVGQLQVKEMQRASQEKNLAIITIGGGVVLLASVFVLKK